jgi:hypothetical protein
MSRKKAARPLSYKARKPRAVSSSGERIRQATFPQLPMQALAGNAGQQCLGHILSRGKKKCASKLSTATIAQSAFFRLKKPRRMPSPK